MKKTYSVSLMILFVLLLSACSGFNFGQQAESSSNEPVRRGPEMMGSGMGPGSGMMNRHHAQVPEDFDGLTNPVPADNQSLARGEEIYANHCATCHGDFGNGDGPGGASLDPAPAPIAHTTQMMGDAYLFWRITEGGVPFETGMIAYRDILEESARWDVINYVRALGSGQVQPGKHFGGQPFDPAEEAANRYEMLTQAVDQGVISQPEADTFDQVHSAMDAYLASEGASGIDTGSRADALPQILSTMVAGDLVTQSQADTFMDIHDRLIEAGLMQ